MPLAVRRSHTAIGDQPQRPFCLSLCRLWPEAQSPQVPQSPQGPQVVHELSEKYTQIKSKIKNESLMFPQIENEPVRQAGRGGLPISFDAYQNILPKKTRER